MINFKYYRIHFIAFRAILRHTYKIKTLRSYISKFFKFIVLNKKVSDKVIIDEGIVHTVFSLFVLPYELKDNHDKLLIKYLSIIPIPSKIYFKWGDNEQVLIDRLISRGHHRITGIRHNKAHMKNQKKPLPDDVQLERASIYSRNSIIIQNKTFEFMINKYGADRIVKC